MPPGSLSLDPFRCLSKLADDITRPQRFHSLTLPVLPSSHPIPPKHLPTFLVQFPTAIQYPQFPHSLLTSLPSAQVFFWWFTIAPSVSIPIPYISQLNPTLSSAAQCILFGAKPNLPCSCIPCHTLVPTHQIHHASLNLFLSPPALKLAYALSACSTSTRDLPSLAQYSSKPPCLLFLSSLYAPPFISSSNTKSSSSSFCLLFLPPSRTSPTPPTIPTLQLSSISRSSS